MIINCQIIVLNSHVLKNDYRFSVSYYFILPYQSSQVLLMAFVLTTQFPEKL